MPKTYDQKCYDLAAIFLGDEPDLHTEHNIVGLASLIQETIEDEIAHLRVRCWRMRAAPMQNFKELLENTSGLSQGIDLRDELLASIAISLKRIADATTLYSGKHDPNVIPFASALG